MDNKSHEITRLEQAKAELNRKFEAMEMASIMRDGELFTLQKSFDDKVKELERVARELDATKKQAEHDSKAAKEHQVQLHNLKDKVTTLQTEKDSKSLKKVSV